MLLEIITPEKIVFSEDVTQVTVPTLTGQISVLAHHVGLLTKVEPGEMMVRKAGKTTYLAIMGGFLEVSKDKTTILADYAVRAEHIEEGKAQQAKKRAEQLMKEKVSTKEMLMAQAELRRSILEIHVARRRRR